MDERKVILITDGDKVARRAVELAASNIGGRCISSSAGNPTPLNGAEIIRRIHEAAHDPVIVMVDDKGRHGRGKGETAMKTILQEKGIRVLGVIAVSSNGKDCGDIHMACSITRDGIVVEGAVDKDGYATGGDKICGDTLSILNAFNEPVIIGLGDPGRMDFKDEAEKGAPITTMALKEVMRRSGEQVHRE